MDRIAGLAGMNLPAPSGVILRCWTGPAGSDRRTLRPLARAELRRMARELVGIDGDVLETGRGPQGIGSWDRLGMSVAYADNRILLAVADGQDVGVDLIGGAAIPDWRAVAALYLDEIPPDALAFAGAWADLEATLKCLGRPLTEGGLGAVPAGLRRMPVPVADGHAAICLRQRGTSCAT